MLQAGLSCSYGTACFVTTVMFMKKLYDLRPKSTEWQSGDWPGSQPFTPD